MGSSPYWFPLGRTVVEPFPPAPSRFIAYCPVLSTSTRDQNWYWDLDAFADYSAMASLRLVAAARPPVKATDTLTSGNGVMD